jgi:YebC/PmpR family DNA-binding regulatory protein
MSGHSKWATIKHKKGAADAKRGRVFTRIIKEITVAARAGGGDPDANPRLRTIVAEAKAENMPADNIKRAIQRGTGELPGAVYEEATYEGYGTNGVAVIVETATDNKNRTVSEIRRLFSKNGGNLGENGCVSWMFSKRGYITLPKEKAGEDDLLAVVLDAGAEDLKDEGDNWAVITPTESFEAVQEAMKKANLTPTHAEVTLIPQNSVKLEGKSVGTMVRMIEELEEHDDVQKVHSNFEADENDLQEVE